MAKFNGRAGNPNGMNWIRPVKRLAIYLRDHFKCIYCECDLTHAEEGFCSLDHLIPRKDGGSNHECNLVTACLSCNVDRGDMPWEIYASEEAYDRILQAIATPLNMQLAKEIFHR